MYQHQAQVCGRDGVAWRCSVVGFDFRVQNWGCGRCGWCLAGHCQQQLPPGRILRRQLQRCRPLAGRAQAPLAAAGLSSRRPPRCSLVHPAGQVSTTPAAAGADCRRAGRQQPSRPEKLWRDQSARLACDSACPLIEAHGAVGDTRQQLAAMPRARDRGWCCSQPVEPARGRCNHLSSTSRAFLVPWGPAAQASARSTFAAPCRGLSCSSTWHEECVTHTAEEVAPATSRLSCLWSSTWQDHLLWAVLQLLWLPPPLQGECKLSPNSSHADCACCAGLCWRSRQCSAATARILMQVSCRIGFGSSHTLLSAAKVLDDGRGAMLECAMYIPALQTAACARCVLSAEQESTQLIPA